MGIHEKKIEEKIYLESEELYKQLEKYVTPALVRAIRTLIMAYNGGKDNRELTDFAAWLSGFLTIEELKKLGKLYPTMLSHKKSRLGGLDIGSLEEMIMEALSTDGKGSIVGLGLLPMMGKGKEDGFFVFEGKASVAKEMERLDMSEHFTEAQAQGEKSALMFSKEKKFYLYSQYKCDGCDKLHYKLFAIDDDGSEKSKKIIKRLQEEYKSDITSA